MINICCKVKNPKFSESVVIIIIILEVFRLSQSQEYLRKIHLNY